MKTVILRNGIVENVVILAKGEDAPRSDDEITVLECADEMEIDAGWRFSDGKFLPPVPSSVTPLQIRKALRTVGLKAQVDAMLSQLPEEIAEEWEYASAIERTNPTLESAIVGLGMTDSQADDLFRLAATF